MVFSVTKHPPPRQTTPLHSTAAHGCDNLIRLVIQRSCRVAFCTGLYATNSEEILTQSATKHNAIKSANKAYPVFNGDSKCIYWRRI